MPYPIPNKDRSIRFAHKYVRNYKGHILIINSVSYSSLLRAKAHRDK